MELKKEGGRRRGGKMLNRERDSLVEKKEGEKNVLMSQVE